jgi:glycosyltransferase involved in cell wall biosynthesis
MDGMEREREKWGSITRGLFLRAEKTAVRCSDALVCDHPEIASYYERQYSVRPEMIAYGADPGRNQDQEMLRTLQVEPGSYYLLVARLEPENNIRMIIEGFLASDAHEYLVIVGRHDARYGRSLYKEFADEGRIKFLGGIYDTRILDHLRHFSKAVFHGHSVGGTNPSLLESMAAGAYIIAHDNIFNRWVLGNNADWFDSAASITALISGGIARGPVENPASGIKKSSEENFIANNLERISSDFNWKDVVKQYEELFERLLQEI